MAVLRVLGLLVAGFFGVASALFAAFAVLSQPPKQSGKM